MANPGQPLVFVYGCGRSGTTLLAVMLDSHPRLAMTFDSKFVVDALRRDHEGGEAFDLEAWSRSLLASEEFARWELDPDETLSALAASRGASPADVLRVLFRIYAAHRGADRYGDKTNRIAHHVPLFADTLPESRFVHLIRDGRNVALSYMEMYWGPTSWDSAARKWVKRVEDGRRSRETLGDGRYLEVRYEDLVAQPEAALRRLCDFAELEFDRALLDYGPRVEGLLAGPLVSPVPIHENLRRPPTAGLRDWRTQMASADVAAFEARAGRLLRELGYPLLDEA